MPDLKRLAFTLELAERNLAQASKSVEIHLQIKMVTRDVEVLLDTFHKFERAHRTRRDRLVKELGECQYLLTNPCPPSVGPRR